MQRPADHTVRRLRVGAVVAALAGLGLLSALIIVQDGRQVLATVLSSGTAVAAVLAIRVGVVAVAGFGWSLLLPTSASSGHGSPVGLRFVREAVNTMMPVAQIGGEIVGARLLAFSGVPGPLAAASVVLDVFLQAATQLVFTVMGVAIFLAIGGSLAVGLWLGLGVLVFGGLLTGFYLLQQFGRIDMLGRLADMFNRDAARGIFGRLQDVQDAAHVIWRDRGRVLRATVVHLGGWLLGVGEVWAAFWLLGTPVSYAEAMVLESVGQAVRSAAFFVPSGVGIQEGGHVATAALLGFSTEIALAMSLIKRVPDLVIGIGGLFAWHRLEMNQRRVRLVGASTAESHVAAPIPPNETADPAGHGAPPLGLEPRLLR